mmetsp:Transcript_23104/g.68070  ORF Transcript_23104/g.68070 Transcript_23104/m.68070 type:complete len:409 (-) Transcript_23104:1206-2432(-)
MRIIARHSHGFGSADRLLVAARARRRLRRRRRTPPPPPGFRWFSASVIPRSPLSPRVPIGVHFRLDLALGDATLGRVARARTRRDVDRELAAPRADGPGAGWPHSRRLRALHGCLEPKARGSAACRAARHASTHAAPSAAAGHAGRGAACAPVAGRLESLLGRPLLEPLAALRLRWRWLQLRAVGQHGLGEQVHAAQHAHQVSCVRLLPFVLLVHALLDLFQKESHVLDHLRGGGVPVALHAPVVQGARELAVAHAGVARLSRFEHCVSSRGRGVAPLPRFGREKLRRRGRVALRRVGEGCGGGDVRGSEARAAPGGALAHVGADRPYGRSQGCDDSLHPLGQPLEERLVGLPLPRPLDDPHRRELDAVRAVGALHHVHDAQLGVREGQRVRKGCGHERKEGEAEHRV